MNTNNGLEIIMDEPITKSETIHEDEILEIVQEETTKPSEYDVVTHDDGKKTVPLFYPFDVTYKNKEGDVKKVETIKSFTFRRISAKDVEALEKVKSDYNKAKLMFARLSDTSDRLYDRLDAKDMSRINSVVTSFLE